MEELCEIKTPDGGWMNIPKKVVPLKTVQRSEGLVQYKRIALIDDSPTRLQIFSVALEKISGVTVRAFMDASEALRDIIENNGYDLIVTDVKMPKMSGISLVREMRHAGIDYHVVVYSSSLEHLADLNNIDGIIPFFNAELKKGEDPEMSSGFVHNFARTVEKALKEAEYKNNFINVRLDLNSFRGRLERMDQDFRSQFKFIEDRIECIANNQLTKEDLKQALKPFQKEEEEVNPDENEKVMLRFQRTISKLWQNPLVKGLVVLVAVAIILFVVVDDDIKKDWIKDKTGIKDIQNSPKGK